MTQSILTAKDINYLKTGLTAKQSQSLFRKWSQLPRETRVSFPEFEKTAYPMIGGDGAVVVLWAGMHLAIETDGYTHS